MVLTNVSVLRAQDMLQEQREELGIPIKKGLIALETHSNGEIKAVVVKDAVEYILSP